jgi:large subunit ribosomal protein L30
MSEQKKIAVKLTKSKYGRKKGHLECIKGLGLRKINHVVELEDTSSIRGMINKVSYLLEVEEVQ